MVFPDVAKVIRGLEHCDKCPTCAGCSYDHEFEVCQMFKEALALITAQRKTLDEIDQYVRELDKAVNGNEHTVSCLGAGNVSHYDDHVEGQ